VADERRPSAPHEGREVEAPLEGDVEGVGEGAVQLPLAHELAGARLAGDAVEAVGEAGLGVDAAEDAVAADERREDDAAVVQVVAAAEGAARGLLLVPPEVGGDVDERAVL
jgi:hypothetical protein